MNALDHSLGSCERGALKTLGAWSRTNHRKNMMPSHVAPQRAFQPVAMLRPAAINAVPVNQAQNMWNGIQLGIRLAMNPRMKKWSTPKMTAEIAKK